MQWQDEKLIAGLQARSGRTVTHVRVRDLQPYLLQPSPADGQNLPYVKNDEICPQEQVPLLAPHIVNGMALCTDTFKVSGQLSRACMKRLEDQRARAQS